MYMKKTIAITGASSGIGSAIALSYAKKGNRLLLLGRDEKKLKRLQTQIRARNAESEVVVADLSNQEEVVKAARTTRRSGDNIDIVVYAAGIYHDTERAFYDIPYHEYTVEQIQHTLNVGLLAPALLFRELIPFMPKDSKIITISGTFENGAKGWVPYYVSKKALEDLTVGLAQDLRPQQIQVNCVSPSDTLTPSYKKFFPQYANAEECLDTKDIAEVVAFLTSKKADHITGQIIEVRQKRIE